MKDLESLYDLSTGIYMKKGKKTWGAERSGGGGGVLACAVARLLINIPAHAAVIAQCSVRHDADPSSRSLSLLLARFPLPCCRPSSPGHACQRCQDPHLSTARLWGEDVAPYFASFS